MRLGRGGESAQLFVRRPSLVSLQIFLFYLFFGGVWGRLEGQTKRTKTDAAFKTSATPKLWNDWVLCRVILREEEVATHSLLLLLQRFLPSSRSISLGALNAAARQLRPSSGVAFKRLLPSTDAALVAWPWRVTVQLVFFSIWNVSISRSTGDSPIVFRMTDLLCELKQRHKETRAAPMAASQKDSARNRRRVRQW